jgi:hypothetical protein
MPAVTLFRHRSIGLTAAVLSAVLCALSGSPAAAQSSLLESVKQNPQKARALCTELKGLNAQGLSYTSPQAVNQIAARQALSPTEAEILSTYVVGLYCPDVR